MPVDSNLTSDDATEVTTTDANDSPPVIEDVVDRGVVGGDTDVAAVDGGAAVTDDAATSQPDADAWRRPYEELGFQNLESPEQAQTRMVEAFRQRDEQLRDAQERLRFVQSVQSRIDSLSGQSPQASAVSKPAEPSDLLTELTAGWVEPDRELVKEYSIVGEDGVVSWRADAPAELRTQVEQYQLKLASYHNKILKDPRKLDEAINARVERLIATRLEGEFTQREQRTTEQQYLSQFDQDNSEWVFAKDPITGERSSELSREGKVFEQFVKKAANEYKLPTKRAQFEYALEQTNAWKVLNAQAPSQQRAAAQQTINAHRAAMLGQVNKAPAKPSTAAGLSDGPGASRTGARRESWGASLVGDLFEERVAS